jgi:hypothetical protein
MTNGIQKKSKYLERVRASETKGLTDKGDMALLRWKERLKVERGYEGNRIYQSLSGKEIFVILHRGALGNGGDAPYNDQLSKDLADVVRKSKRIATVRYFETDWSTILSEICAAKLYDLIKDIPPNPGSGTRKPYRYLTPDWRVVAPHSYVRSGSMLDGYTLAF